MIESQMARKMNPHLDGKVFLLTLSLGIQQLASGQRIEIRIPLFGISSPLRLCLALPARAHDT